MTIKYDDIPRIAKRFSFSEKMRVLERYSSNLININKSTLDLYNDRPLPWELETLLLFFVKNYEWKQDSFDIKKIKQFIDMINCIKMYESPLLDKKDIDVTNLLVAYSSNQFEQQEIWFYKFYRYNYFYSFCNEKINIREKFYSKFSFSYDEIIDFSTNIIFWYGFKENYPVEVLQFLNKKYNKIFVLFSKTRDEFIELMDRFAKSIDDFMYCIKPCNTYPFIEYNSFYYLPLPHCIIQATTKSLMYRFTENDNALRQDIGFVLEKYLFEIMSNSKVYSEVLSEKTYGKENKKTFDVMCRTGDNYLFIESKAMVPFANTRCLEFNSIEKEKDKICSAMNQVFNQIYNEFLKGKYYFFSEDKETIEKHKCFGLVVLLEESYIRRSDIYDYYAKKYGLDKNGEEYKWFIHHIKVCNLYEVEKHCFCEISIIDALNKQIEDNQPTYYAFTNTDFSYITKNEKVLEFKNMQRMILKNFVDELVENGIITK